MSSLSLKQSLIFNGQECLKEGGQWGSVWVLEDNSLTLALRFWMMFQVLRIISAFEMITFPNSAGYNATIGPKVTKLEFLRLTVCFGLAEGTAQMVRV